MSVFSRYKRAPEGFRQIVELWEATSASKRQKMIDIGKVEDPEYTARILQFTFSWEDIVKLPDMELAEVVAKTPAKIVGYALQGLPEQVAVRFLKCASPPVAAEAKEFMTAKIGPREIDGARLKIITVARECERGGKVKTKRIAL
ncbi:hypothetical protein K2X30_03245 [bacterium]|jgi:flagellar motor switch protein FliG|nr:hypothetical protein [bacterium]